MDQGGGCVVIGFFQEVIAWFTDPAHWSGINGIPNRTWEHVQITVLATAVAALVAIPLAVILGHRRQGGTVAVGTVNLFRAVPSFGIVVLALPITVALGMGFGFWPTFLALLFLAIPPMFANTYTGVAGVDPELVDAARGMGMTDTQSMFGVEVPTASPIILAAVRIAAVQVVATATLGAVVGWGGLGRYIIDGFAIRDDVTVFAGALLVAALALATQITMTALERVLVPKGVRSAGNEVAGIAV
jgi:osmoprotectant transport system permease protein